MRDIKQLIKDLTLEEKAGLCSGLDYWHTKAVERLGIPSIMMTDGPHGLRKQAVSADHLGINQSVPATCFPSGSGLACSWDTSMIKEVGVALGEECQAQNVAVLLGPAANIKRTPLCGRNFEYYSEDPFLSSELAVSYIDGVQSKGVGTSLKHYAANNMETRRMTINSIIDERTLREIYLASFENAVKKSQPWTVMCAYNKVNGEYCSENSYLLNQVLKEEWGHEGIVVSDWGAVNDRPQGLAAGLELEMPYSGGESDKKIAEAVRSGDLSEKVLDNAVERLLKLVFKAVDAYEKDAVCDYETHYQLARRISTECAVLLKNQDAILPLSKSAKIGVFGAFALMPRFQGGGSSHINPYKVDVPLDAVKNAVVSAADVYFAQGYQSDEKVEAFANEPFKSKSDIPDEKLIAEAVEMAQKVEVAVIFAGLPETYESEGFDRKHMKLPEGQDKLIEAVCAVQQNVVVVLSNGAPVEMPWIDKVKGVLECYLGGEAFGAAAADMLFGDVNPSGKLAETFPVKLCDNPSYLNFPGDDKNVEYREGLFVGYRYYDKKQVKPLFPFGFGLSYANFEYTGISIDKSEISDTDKLTVSVSVKNTGKYSGKEIVQLYVSDVETNVVRPVKELKGFAKVALEPGEEKTVSFVLDKRSFAYYNTSLKDWVVESGEFKIMAGKSSAEIVLEKSVFVKSTTVMEEQYDLNTTFEILKRNPNGGAIVDELLQMLSEGMGIPLSEDNGMFEMFKTAPLRQFVQLSQGKISERRIMEMLNCLG